MASRDHAQSTSARTEVEPLAPVAALDWALVDRFAHTTMGAAADRRLTSYATGTRFIDVYGHPIEGDKQFRADIAAALNQITELAMAKVASLGSEPQPRAPLNGQPCPGKTQ